jgi:hypothetical protein
MSFLHDKIINFAFIAKSQAVSLQPAAGVTVTRSNLPEGTVVFTDMQNRAVTTLPATGEFKIAYKAPNNDIIWSAPIRLSDTTVSSRAFVPEKEELYFVGYNGTTGLVPSANSTSYHVFLRRKENSKLRRGVGYDTDITAQYTTSGAATQQEWATNMQGTLVETAKDYETELSNEWPGYVRIEAINDGTSGVFTGIATAVKVTKGSPVVEFVLASTGAASTGTVAAGDVIQLPSSGAKRFTFTALDAITHVVTVGNDVFTLTNQGSAALNAAGLAALVNATGKYFATVSTADVSIMYNPCFAGLPPVVWDGTNNVLLAVTAFGDNLPVAYVVKTGVTAGAAFELTVPFQGESGVAGEGAIATSAGVLSAITNWGIKFAAVRNQYDVYRWRDFYKNTFDVRVMRGNAPDSVLVTHAVKPSLGSGTFPQVAEDEFVSYGNYGRNRIITDMPPLRRPALALECGKYSLVQMNVKRELKPELVGGIGVLDSVFKFWLETPNNGVLVPGSQGDEIATTLVAGFTTAALDVVPTLF